MIRVPHEVAKMVVLNGFHPVKAWRYYFRMSEEALAENIDVDVLCIRKIECSNLHLKQPYFDKLTKAFGIVADALKVRYTNFQDNPQQGLNYAKFKIS